MFARRSGVSNRIAPLVLLAAVVGAGVFAVLRADSALPPMTEPPSTRRFGEDLAGDHEGAGLPPNHPPIGAGALPNAAGALPPNHPPIGAGNAPSADSVQANDESAAVAWKVPDGWKTAPNPNAMRIATYRVSRAPGDSDDAEVSVSRAGGTTVANLQRWVGQFDEAGQDKQTVLTVRGLKITIVEVGGTYQGGMTGGPASAPRRGWALLGAVVETPGSPYFFKMTGPSATVRAARASFDALLESLTPP